MAFFFVPCLCMIVRLLLRVFFMTLEIAVLLVAGLAILTFGADLLVRGSVKLAYFFGISPLVTGLTIVAFGTSAPELAVSLNSALEGNADIAMGNVVGSNICNILLILGLSAVLLPLVVRQQLIRVDVPIMIGISLLLYWLAMDGVVSRTEGLILFGIVIVYVAFLIWLEKRELPEVEKEYEAEYKPQEPITQRGALLNGIVAVTGLTLLIVGADWMVDGAVQLARSLGVSELIIGLTIVALGTSLPEVATSVVAALKGERDIAVGNVVGSNIFNILSVLGLSAAIAPAGVAVSPTALAFDLPVMAAVAILCLPIFFTGSVISRPEGAILLFYYIAYLTFLILDATRSHALSWYREVMMLIVIPATVSYVFFEVFRHIRAARTSKSRQTS